MGKGLKSSFVFFGFLANSSTFCSENKGEARSFLLASATRSLCTDEGGCAVVVRRGMLESPFSHLTYCDLVLPTFLFVPRPSLLDLPIH